MNAQRRVGVGIIGTGNISSAYLKAMQGFDVLDIRGLADLKADLAAKRAEEFGVPAYPSVEALLADPTVEIVVNLTIPRAHVDVGLRALEAGKHVYGEKPLGITFAEGKKLVDAARAKGLRVGARHLPGRRPSAVPRHRRFRCARHHCRRNRDLRLPGA
jgi:predicted dehydrogenase